MQIKIEQMQEGVDEVKRLLLTSNDLVNRSAQPYYYGHTSVPPFLTEFKIILTELRAYAAGLIHELGVQRIGSMDVDFSEGGFFHSYLLGLVVASFGIGECAESTYKLAERLIKKGAKDFLFVSLILPSRSIGMEVSHGLLVANVREISERITNSATLGELIAALPDTAVIGDAFLGISYLPKSGFPLEMSEYLSAYGGAERITQVFHFYNFSANVLSNFQLKAIAIIKKIQEEQKISTQKPIGLNRLTKLSEDTQLLKMLKEKSPLPFVGYRDDDFYVYALASLTNKTEWCAAIKLRAYLPQGSVIFFRGAPQELNKQSVVIRQINVSEVAHRIDEYTDDSYQSKFECT